MSNLGQRRFLRIKDGLIDAVVENCSAPSFNLAVEIAEEVMDALDDLLFSDLGLEMSEEDIQAEVATFIFDGINKRGLEIKGIGGSAA